jgi:hypothetical protein
MELLYVQFMDIVQLFMSFWSFSKTKNKKFDVDVYNTIAHFELFVKSNGAVNHMKRNKNNFHSLRSFVFFVLEKKNKLRNCIFAPYLRLIPLFFNILYPNFNLPINFYFLHTLSLSKKLKPPKKLKTDRNKPNFLTRYTSSGERLCRQASTPAGFSILLNEIIP